MTTHEILPVVLAVPTLVIALWSGITGWRLTLKAGVTQ